MTRRIEDMARAQAARLSRPRGGLIVRDPATAEVIAEVTNVSPADALSQLDAAQRGFASWSRMTAEARSEALMRWRAALLEAADEAAGLITLEQGKPVREARAEVASGLRYLAWNAGEARRLTGEVLPRSAQDHISFATSEPVGVVLALTPWNFPFGLALRKISAVLAAGCAALLKPSEKAPLSGLFLAAIAASAGLPKGAVSVVTAEDPGPVVDSLLDDDRIGAVSLTGSANTGRRIAERAARRFLATAFELGGNAPFIIFADADLERALDAAAATKLRNAGQVCVAPNRFLVERSLAERFAEALHDRMGRVRVGRGFDDDVIMGPVIDEEAHRRLAALITTAQARGASVLGGYDAPGGPIMVPCVVVDVTDDDPLVATEIFGPLSPVLPFDEEDEVLHRANAVAARLSASVWTGDVARAQRAAGALRFGMVSINTALASDPAAPFAGIGAAGLGQEGGRAGLATFLRPKHTTFGQWGG